MPTVPHVEAFPRPEEVIDHRRSALMLDGILHAVPGESASGLWLPGAEHFDGHFDGMPILPGIKQMEALAQLTAYTVLLELGPTKFGLFAEVERYKFVEGVKPGELLQLSIRIGAKNGKLTKAMGIASVNRFGVEKVASAGILVGSSMPRSVVTWRYGTKKVAEGRLQPDV